MPTEGPFAPDAILTSSGWGSIVLANIDEDPDSPDTNWATASNNNTDVSARFSFPTPTGNPTGVQTFKAHVRKQGGTGTPSVRLSIFESGTLLFAGSNQSVTSLTGQLLTQTFDLTGVILADPSGAGLEIEFIGTKSGGSPVARAAVDLGAINWDTVTYAAGGAPQTITVGGIASAEAFGTAVLTSTVDLAPSGVASGEAFGTPLVHVAGWSVEGGTGYGTFTFGQSTYAGVKPEETTEAQYVSPSIITSAEAFGNGTIIRGTVFATPAGIGSAEEFGTVALTLGDAFIAPAGIETEEHFPDPVLTAVAFIIATGIASAEAFGGHTVTTGAVTVAPAGVASAEAFGAASLTTGAVTVTAAGIASSEALGTASITPGAVTLTPTAITSAEQFGAATLTTGPVTVATPSITSSEAFGAALVSGATTFVAPTSITSAEQFGTIVITPGHITILAEPITTQEAFGLLTTTTGEVTLTPGTITSLEAIGGHTITLFTGRDWTYNNTTLITYAGTTTHTYNTDQHWHYTPVTS